MKYLCIAENYEVNGEKKTRWNRIGIMLDGKNGSQFIKLFHIPNVAIQVFEAEKREQSQDSGSVDF